VGLPWNFTWGGSNGNPIYIGVDQTWFSGTSWSRPILNGDNPLGKSPVASCTYDESSTTFVFLSGPNQTFDNFELLGGCWRGTQNNFSQYTGMTYIAKGAPSNPVNIIIENVYIHGWTHVTFSCGSGGASGNCDGAGGIAGDSHSNGGQGNQLVANVIDGSDSDSTSLGAMGWDCYDAHYNVIRYNSNGFVCNNMHTFHDNLIEYISESSDGQTHSNGFEFNSEWAGTNTVYNNVVRHMTTAVTGWVNPSQVDYDFNNIIYDTLQQNWDIDTTGGGTAMYFYNNTIVGGGVGSSGSWEGVLEGNIFINGGAIGTPKSSSNSINWTTAQAFTAGYIDANSGSANVIAPTSPNCNGVTPCAVGAATNQASLCSTYPALCSDTTLGVSYDSVNHVAVYPGRTAIARPASGAGNWDAGAYMSSDPSQPSPPTGLTAIVN
jgi:hypothetical protein